MDVLVRTLSVVFISCIKINFKLFQIFKMAIRKVPNRSL